MFFSVPRSSFFCFFFSFFFQIKEKKSWGRKFVLNRCGSRYLIPWDFILYRRLWGRGWSMGKRILLSSGSVFYNESYEWRTSFFRMSLFFNFTYWRVCLFYAVAFMCVGFVFARVCTKSKSTNRHNQRHLYTLAPGFFSFVYIYGKRRESRKRDRLSLGISRSCSEYFAPKYCCAKGGKTKIPQMSLRP